MAKEIKKEEFKTAQIYEKMADKANMLRLKHNAETILDKIKLSAIAGIYVCQLDKMDDENIFSKELEKIFKSSGFVINRINGDLYIAFGEAKSFENMTLHDLLNIPDET